VSILASLYHLVSSSYGFADAEFYVMIDDDVHVNVALLEIQ
jgi:hypothetical protein